MNDIGEKISKRRKELGLSQDELAIKVGYSSRSSVNKVEKGGRDIPRKKVELFAAALDLSIDYLMNGDVSRGPAAHHVEMLCHSLGYIMGGDEDEGYMWLRYNGVNYDITEKEWSTFIAEIVSYTKYKLYEMTEQRKDSRT